MSAPLVPWSVLKAARELAERGADAAEIRRIMSEAAEKAIAWAEAYDLEEARRQQADDEAYAADSVAADSVRP